MFTSVALMVQPWLTPSRCYFSPYPPAGFFFFATSRLAVAVQPYSPLPGLNLSLERDPAFKFLSSFLFSLFIFSWRIIALQYCVFVKHPHESAIGIHMSPPSWTSFPPPSPAHPSRLSQSPSLGSLRHTANSLWLSVLHMIVYMFACYSLNSSHLLFLPPSPCPQVCSLWLRLHCCCATTFISPIFLDFIYMH